MKAKPEAKMQYNFTDPESRRGPRVEHSPSCNWLSRVKLRMVGAIGFEPMTSTV